MRIARSANTAAIILTLATTAFALPRPGEPFPRMSAQDLTGEVHSTNELTGQRTLVVAITNRGAANAMRAWYAAADSRVPSNVGRESLLSLQLPFFVSMGQARDKARHQVPRQYWQATLLDRGDMAKQLGLEDGQVPYVFVLDKRGIVVAAVHATVEAPQAREIWNALP
jgi:hypothetical protein